ncbi:hypothetical protein SAY87_004296 [Trapa incisa]|uniref:Uncharacterized protein n=1 Tax=Trapa incisa TaxID=236973 RepID=A0AAN7PLY3_9MYRT|nr:hypothetical protein SAY87_004296 [Trapa incisa]
MASWVDPLVVGRVIGDVVDMFVPMAGMTINYGMKHINNGCQIKPSMAADAPKVTISGNSDELYTLVMTDPDAPSPSEPTMREWVHWYVASLSSSARKEILAYMGPRPPVGIHRYILLLFKQRDPIGLMDQPSSRANFNTRHFAGALGLGLPVAAVYFNSQKEPSSNRRRHH